ncbi:murein hydrolase activator EnvC family protein [Mucilaginibacter antarcticus]|uniref:Murein hydrolase activator EnvC family protein n=1 Tax=Mucilaginibacter antarcticus TaxID=1855725 RepID=A0ABW5XMH3_9SPHI
MKFLKAFLLFVVVFAALNARAQSSSELKKQRERITNELNELTRELAQTQSNKKSTLKQLSILKAQISLRERKIDVINGEVRNLNNQISENTNTVHDLQGQLDLLKRKYADMVLFAYRNKSAHNKLMFIFAAQDFNQAYKRLKYLQQFATYRERQAASIEGKQKSLNNKIVELDKTKTEKHTLLVDQEKEKETLGKERNTQSVAAKNLTKQEKSLLRQRQSIQAEVKRVTRAVINAELRERREEEERRAAALRAERARAAAAAAAAGKDAPVVAKVVPRKTDSQLLNATPEAAKLSSDFLGNRGRLPWPVSAGEITQGFGTYMTEGIRSESNGLDIRTNNNAPVRAVFEGTVSKVSNVLGTYMIIVNHGEYFTVYSNLKTTSVSAGQKVSTKQNIGTAAADVGTSDTMVHFELYKAGAAVNPKFWLADR